MTSNNDFTPNLKPFSPYGLGFLILILIILGAIIGGLPADWRAQESFLDNSASLMADLTIMAYILLLVPMMIAGYFFAVNKQFVPHHQLIMTAIVILNWGLISFIMVSSIEYTVSNVPDSPDENFYLPILHASIGLLAQLLGTYLVIRMWFEDELPDVLKVKNIKLYMRITLAGWLLAAALGFATYVTYYDPFDGSSGGDVAPDATPEVTQPAPEPADDDAATPEPDAAEETDDTDGTAPEPEATEEAESTEGDGADEVPSDTDEGDPEPEATEEASDGV